MGCYMAHLELRKKDPPTIQVIRKLADCILSRVITKKVLIQEYQLLQLSSSKIIFQIFE